MCIEYVMLMEQYSVVLQVEEKADSIMRAVKTHVESTNDVSFTMLIDRYNLGLNQPREWL